LNHSFVELANKGRYEGQYQDKGHLGIDNVALAAAGGLTAAAM
jgi:hypothetical protein